MQHTFDSAHLVGGPHIGFFRCGDKVKILWKSYDNAVLENGENIWTSPNGVYEMSWNDFTKEVEIFYLKYHQEMESRTDYIYKHGLTHAQIDREILLHSKSNSIEAFRQHLALLFSDDYEKTDFDSILFLYEKMRREINEQELQEISDS